MALESCPKIEQFFVEGAGDKNETDFERALYILRRRIEKDVDAKTAAATLFIFAPSLAGLSSIRAF